MVFYTKGEINFVVKKQESSIKLTSKNLSFLKYSDLSNQSGPARQLFSEPSTNGSIWAYIEI